jgi:phage N-6-adenine-methyltransferase
VTHTVTKPKHTGRPRTDYKRRPATDAERQRRWRQKQKPSRGSQVWATPQGTFDEWNAAYHFTVDVCALPENAKCARYFTPEQDGLQQDWSGEICWCNPPYTRYVLDRWVHKAYDASQAGATVVCLLPVSTTSQWWKRYVSPLPDDRITYLEKRLKFGGSCVNAMFDRAIVIFRPQADVS